MNVSHKKRYWLICNPHSGIKRHKNNTVDRIKTTLELNDKDVTAYYTEYPNHATELAKAAIADGVDIVVAIGGDGTVNEVATALLGSNLVLGIIPMGSGNGLARELSIPMNEKDAIACLLKGEAIQMDVCNVNSHHFLCTCGVGFDAEVTERFAKRDDRGPIGYLVDTVEAISKHEPLQCTVTVDDKVYDGPVFLVTCANSSQYGNNAYIAPHADLTDGIFDVTILKEFPRIYSGQLAYQLFSKGIDKNPYVHTMQGREVDIRLPKAVSYHTDGEAREHTDHLVFKMHKGALNVIAGAYDKRETTLLDIFNMYTNNYLEWKDGVLQDLYSAWKVSLKEISAKIEEGLNKTNPRKNG